MANQQPNELTASSEHDKLVELCGFTHQQQAIWYLNAFWGERQEKAEEFWLYTHKFNDLDQQTGKAGHSLDELNAHRFLEAFNNTMTVRELREKLRGTKCIGPTERPKGVPITHFLLAYYGDKWEELVSRPQGGNQEKLNEAQRRLDEVSEKFRIAEEAERPFKVAHLELQAALAEVKAQEDAYNTRTAELKKKSETGGVVSRNKAANELSQHLAEDPLPLRKAKITVEAAEKRAQKARAPFEAATNEAQKALQEAQDYLNELKKMAGQPHGLLWWMDRELEEKRRYMPLSKGGTTR